MLNSSNNPMNVLINSKKPSTQGIKKILNQFGITCPENIDLSGYYGNLTNDSRGINIDVLAADTNAGDIFKR